MIAEIIPAPSKPGKTPQTYEQFCAEMKTLEENHLKKMRRIRRIGIAMQIGIIIFGILCTFSPIIVAWWLTR